MSENDTFTQPHLPPLPKAPGRHSSARRVRLAGYLVGVLLTAALGSLTLWLTQSLIRKPDIVPTSPPVEATAVAPLALQRPLVTEDELVEKSGVRIATVAVTGAGGLIDLRYQVVDPDKASVVHDENYPPILVDEATGLVVNQPLMGHLHTGEFAAGQTYYIIFENPGNIIQQGAKVSVLLGDAEVDHIIVK